jgi:hypothetical protein
MFGSGVEHQPLSILHLRQALRLDTMYILLDHIDIFPFLIIYLLCLSPSPLSVRSRVSLSMEFKAPATKVEVFVFLYHLTPTSQ